MALNRLNLTNTKTTAKPVNGKKGGKLNALLSALGSTEQITQQFMNQQLVAKEEQLVKDKQADAASVEIARAKNEDLSKLDLKTTAGVAYKDEISASDTINKISREEQIKGAELGRTLEETKSAVQSENIRRIEAAGTPEEKALLAQKSNAMGRQFSQNIFASELADAKNERRMLDENAVLGATNKEGLTPNQIKIYDKTNASQDAIVATNNSQIVAIEQGLDANAQIKYLRAEVDALIIKNGSPEYVNTLEKQFATSEAAIRKQGAIKSANKATDLSNKSQQEKSKVFWENTDYDSGAMLEAGLASGEISEQNALNSLYATIKEMNFKGEQIPDSLMNIIESDRPSGVSGWLYTDGQVGQLVNSNRRIMENQSKSSEALDWTAIAAYKNDLATKTDKGILLKEDIDKGVSVGAISEREAATWGSKLIDQKRDKHQQLVFATAMNEGNPASQQAVVGTMEPNQIQKGIDTMFSDNYKDINGNNDLNKFLQDITSNVNSPIVQKQLNAIQVTGMVPTDIKNRMNTSTNDWDTFVSNQNLLNSVADRNIKNALRGSMTQQSRNVSDMYQSIMQTNPDLEPKEIKSILAKTESIGSGFIAANQPTPDYTSSQWNTDLTGVINELQDPNSPLLGSLGFADLEFSNKTAMSEIAGRLYNQFSITNPDSSPEQKWGMVGNSITKNYSVIGETMISNNTSLPDDKIVANYDVHYEPYLKQVAMEQFGDPERWDELTIVSGTDTDLTGKYNIAIKNTNGGQGTILGQTFMLENSDGNTPSFKDFADWYTKIDMLKSEKRVKSTESQGDFNVNKFAGASPFGLVSSSNVAKSLNEYEGILDRESVSYKTADLSNQLMNSAGFQPIFSANEIKSNTVNVGRQTFNLDKKRNDKEAFELKEKIIKTSINRAKQKFLTNDKKGFKSLNTASQNKLITQYLTRLNKDITIKDLYDTETNNIKKLNDKVNEMYTGEDTTFEFLLGLNPMYGSYKQWQLLEREDAKQQIETGIK